MGDECVDNFVSSLLFAGLALEREGEKVQIKEARSTEIEASDEETEQKEEPTEIATDGETKNTGTDQIIRSTKKQTRQCDCQH